MLLIEGIEQNIVAIRRLILKALDVVEDGVQEARVLALDSHVHRQHGITLEATQIVWLDGIHLVAIVVGVEARRNIDIGQHSLLGGKLSDVAHRACVLKLIRIHRHYHHLAKHKSGTIRSYYNYFSVVLRIHII